MEPLIFIVIIVLTAVISFSAAFIPWLVALAKYGRRSFKRKFSIGAILSAGISALFGVIFVYKMDDTIFFVSFEETFRILKTALFYIVIWNILAVFGRYFYLLFRAIKKLKSMEEESV